MIHVTRPSVYLTGLGRTLYNKTRHFFEMPDEVNSTIHPIEALVACYQGEQLASFLCSCLNNSTILQYCLAGLQNDPNRIIALLHMWHRWMLRQDPSTPCLHFSFKVMMKHICTLRKLHLHVSLHVSEDRIGNILTFLAIPLACRHIVTFVFEDQGRSVEEWVEEFKLECDFYEV